MCQEDREGISQLNLNLKPTSVVIAVDISGSMSGYFLEEAKKVTLDFIQNINMDNIMVAILQFADQTLISVDLTHNKTDLIRDINSWKTGVLGYHNSSHPFDEALRILKDDKKRRIIVLITDGVWSCNSDAINGAKKSTDNGIEIISVGLGNDNKEFLKKITNP